MFPTDDEVASFPRVPMPFIPLESEIDQLIAGLSVLLATVSQILKETAVRVGEATEIRWTDVDFEKRLIYINHPEKRSKTGVYPVSEKCISLIKQLPREGEKIFKSKKSIVIHFREQRNKLAYKLNNPRLKEIHFHTLRHWKATMEAYKTRDPFIVQRLLRHKNLKNTQRYIHLAETMFGALTDDDFTVKVAETKEEAIKLLEIGFTYVGNILGYEMFKKRK